ncbi:NAD(P)H-dependent flavin oxidoreductase [Nocardioides sp. Bht2]|uniref:NAD(P)H-dependent flavin oxidoreductase n=1 Tax=Nocardioides sp. Bht2 TaxID=3392297 RepID=UPI0039B5C243
MFSFRDLELGLASAPMAGGATTVALARAVAEAGGFPFLAAGYKSPEALGAEVAAMRASGHPYGVNLFVPDRRPVDEQTFHAYAARLGAEADSVNAELDERIVHDDDAWAAKVALLLTDPVPVVSLTFGLPAADEIAALQAVGTSVLATVTSVGEALAAADAGVDGLVFQGVRAGGHSATFDPTRPLPDQETEVGLRQVLAAVPLPVIAGGGISGPDDVRRLLAAGADTVAVGTLLLRATESGASATHQNALVDPRYTATTITRAFTGRPARGLSNGFIERHEPHAPLGYPEIHHLTRGIRQAAARAGDAERLHLWAGTGYRNAEARPVAEILGNLASR